MGSHVMEGLSHRGSRRPGLLVLPPPPEEGGGMDHVVGAELAWAAAREGFPSLRFNWRGVGASQGRRATSLEALVEDARAALLVARDNSDAPPLVASLGGSSAVALALLGAEGDAAGACLVSPRAPLVIEEWGSKVWVVVAQSDLSSRVQVATGQLQVIPGADRTFQKNLPLVGKAVVECLQALETLK